MKTDDIEELMLSNGITGFSMAYMEAGHSLQSLCAGYADELTRRPIESSTAFHVCSVSKFVTAFLTITLASEDKLSLDTNINDMLCTWKLDATSYNAPSLLQLLQHQGGIIDPKHSFPALPVNSTSFSTAQLLNGKTIGCSKRIVTEQKPGTVFSYSDAGYMIIQLALEDTYQQPFEELMKSYVFNPLGMKNSFFHHTLQPPFAYGHQHLEPIPNLYPYYPYDAACGLWTTSTDLMKLIDAFHQSLNGSSSAIVEQKDAERMLQSNAKIPFAGLGLFLDTSAETVEYSSLGWGEGFQCLLAGKPEKDDVLLCMINTNPGKHQMESFLGDIYKRSSLAR